MFSPASREEKRYNRKKCILRTLFVLYIVVLCVLCWQFHLNEAFESDAKRYALYVILGITVNVIILFSIGILGIRTLVFPQSFWISRQLIIGSNTIQYASDFVALLQKIVVILTARRSNQSIYSKQLADQFYFVSEYSNEQINGKFKSLIDLVALYSNSNQILIDKNSKILPKSLIEINKVLLGIKSIFDTLETRIRDK